MYSEGSQFGISQNTKYPHSGILCFSSVPADKFQESILNQVNTCPFYTFPIQNYSAIQGYIEGVIKTKKNKNK
jgi:hypothetical protein